MTDPYQEATRHERTGLSTAAKVFLIGGGLLAAVVIAGRDLDVRRREQNGGGHRRGRRGE